MTEVLIRQNGSTGHITLNRPKALNALSYGMVRAIDTALKSWRDDDTVQMVLFDATGEKAFCAGGDIADLYHKGIAGDIAYGQNYWADEYRLNAKIAAYPKPTVSFMQGFTMGGGVGIGCHCAHRVVNPQSVVAMPECSIGLVPDVGGSWILARAPGQIGLYLGTTGRRISGLDILYTGFADHLVEQAEWQACKGAVLASGDPSGLPRYSAETLRSEAPLAQAQSWIDHHFKSDDLAQILASLRQGSDPSDMSTETLKTLTRNSPLSMACAARIIRQLQAPGTSLAAALEQEYRFTTRAMQHGDFLEGIRAAIIDKDRNPQWQHPIDAVPADAVDRMLAPLGPEELDLTGGSS